jgi:hypothetical protein
MSEQDQLADVDVAVRARALLMLSRLEFREQLRNAGWSTADMKHWLWSGDVPGHIPAADNPHVDTRRYMAEPAYRAPFQRQVVIVQMAARKEHLRKRDGRGGRRVSRRSRVPRARRVARTIGSRGDPAEPEPPLRRRPPDLTPLQEAQWLSAAAYEVARDAGGRVFDTFLDIEAIKVARETSRRWWAAT